MLIISSGESNTPIDVPPIPKDFDEQLLGERLETILEQLPERERLVITMKFYNELSHEEIGEILHLQANHVGVIVHRALKKCQNVASEPLTGMLYEHLS